MDEGMNGGQVQCGLRGGVEITYGEVSRTQIREAFKAKPESVDVTWQQLGAMEGSRQKATQSDLCLSWTKLPRGWS